MFISCREHSCDPLWNFSGITKRNSAGILVSHDDGDWTLKDKWGNREIELFDKDYNTDCYPPYTYSILAYPNPTKGEFQLVFDKSNATQVDIRLVDFDCRVLVSHDGIRSNSIGLQSGNYTRNGIVRLYYKFIEDGCEYQGHGDIQIEL
jgi:hypothetical protein